MDPSAEEKTPDAVTPKTEPGSRRRRLLIAAILYLVCAAVFAIVAGKERLAEHTSYNHYAHLADAWLHGRQDLRNGAPGYAGGNDFAEFEGKTYISFPPFPAVLMVPLVAVAGSPENFRDGQFVIWLAGLGPALLFLVLEKIRRMGLSARTERENILLTLLMAFGTVYFFTAVEGTVWFAAHVVGVALAAGYVLVALDAELPWVAGLLMACAWMTRPTLLLTTPIFALEAIRVCCKGGLPETGTFAERVAATWQRVDKRALANKYFAFAVPLLASFAVGSWMNVTRYHNPSPFAFGHEHLGVVWHGRIERWGLFGYHYLSKNLGVMLTILPWRPPHNASGPGVPQFQINEHGLALWFTTPLYFWLFRPKQRSWHHDIFALSAILVATMLLFYQNSGWRQFGYRFSNDYVVLLFVLLALGGRPIKRSLFALAAVWGVWWNLFGAISFDRGGEWDRYYFREGTQTVLYQAD